MNFQSYVLLVTVLYNVLLPYEAQASLMLSGIGNIQGNRYFVEFYVIQDVQDLSIYGIGVSHGSGPTSQTYTFDSVSKSAGDFFYLSNKDNSFMNDFFGLTVSAYKYSGLDLKFGDDSVELFHLGMVSWCTPQCILINNP